MKESTTDSTAESGRGVGTSAASFETSSTRPTANSPIPVDVRRPASGTRITKTVENDGQTISSDIDDLRFLDEIRPFFISAEAVLEQLKTGKDREDKPFLEVTTHRASYKLKKK